MKRTIFALLLVALMVTLLPALSQQANAADATSPTKFDTINMTGIHPALGGDIANLPATVSQQVTLESVSVYNSFTGELLTEGKFEPGMVYKITYVMDIADGYSLTYQYVHIWFNQHYIYTVYPETAGQIVLTITLDTHQHFSQINLSIPTLQPGMNPKDISISVPSNATYYVESFKVIDLNDKSKEVESLQAGQKYQLSVTVAAKEGYLIKSSSNTSCNGALMSTTVPKPYITGTSG